MIEIKEVTYVGAFAWTFEDSTSWTTKVRHQADYRFDLEMVNDSSFAVQINIIIKR